MSTPIDIVTTFMKEWEKSNDALHQSHHIYFTPQTIWENVGVLTTVGVEEAVAVIRKSEEQTGLDTVKTEILAISATGNLVLTERVDHFIGREGKELACLRIMGIFEVEDGKIVKWRDYFDPAALGPLSL